MAGALALLNLDNTYPTADPYRAANLAGVVRFLSRDDSALFDSRQRIDGDLVHRDALIQQKINELIFVLNSDPSLNSFDDTNFMFCDGTKPFTAAVGGVDPTLSSHLTTRNYVDGVQASVDGRIAVQDQQINNLTNQIPLYSTSIPWVEHVWNAGVKQYLDLPLSRPVTVLDRVMHISLIEKIDIARPTTPIPDPDPIWVYRPVTANGSAGALVEDMWLKDNNTVRILLPNVSKTPSGYPSGTGDLSAPRQRFYRAFVTEYRTESPIYDQIQLGDTGAQQITMSCAGTLFTSLTFGYWVPSVSVRLYGVQISAQDIPSGADVHIELLKDGVATGAVGILPSGNANSNTTFAFAFDSPVTLVAGGQTLMFRVTQVGSTAPGAFVTTNLIYRPMTA